MRTGSMHLNGFMMYTPMMHSIGSWSLPENEIVQQFGCADFWQGIAKTLEAGCFDMAFFGDHMAPYDVYKGDPLLSVRYGLQFPVHDPVCLVPWMAAATERLGLGVTMSTAFYQPYLLVRKLSTLDHLSNGRMAWNVITSAQDSEMRNMGLGGLLPHDRRYDRAEEYLDVCYQLWSGWEPDALVCDKATGQLVDTDRVHAPSHDGEFFSVHALSSVCASPQGRPVIMQAGASDRGMDFAAKHAEVVFGSKRSVEDMARFSMEVGKRAAKFGRSREDIKVVYGASVILGKTEREAQDRLTAFREMAGLEPSLAKLSGITGVDLSQYDPDQPIEDVDAPGARGVLQVYTRTAGKALTLREAALEYGSGGGGFYEFVGTADHVADEMERVQRAGDGDGFNLTPRVLPGGYEEFVQEVVPRLQSRGLLKTKYPGDTLRDVISE